MSVIALDNKKHLSQSNLVLEAGIRGVSRGGRQREVVVEVTSAQVRTSLRDNLRTFHGLTIPESSSVL